MPARSQRTFEPGSSLCLTIRGGSNRESTTFTVTVWETASRSTAIPSTIGVPRTSARRQATIGGGTVALDPGGRLGRRGHEERREQDHGPIIGAAFIPGG